MQHQVASVATMCFTELGLPTTMNVLQSKELYSSVDELSPKVRKPYTITKQRERWTEDEHKKFLESLKLYGRAWRKIEEHIGTKTAVQIRSHAQKFFTKVARETANNGADSPNSMEIPPPRPKKKPMHPYPRKLENICEKGVIVSGEDKSPHLLDMSPRMGSSDMISSIIEEENGSPSSAFSVTGRDLLELNQVNREVHVSHAAGSSTHDGFGPENGFSSPSLSTDLNLVESFIPPLHDKGFSSPDLMSKITSLDQPSTFSNVDSSISNSKEETCCEETTDSVSAIKDPSTEPSIMSLKLFGQTVLVNPSSAMTIKRHKSPVLPFSTIEDDSLEKFTGNEIVPSEKEVDCNIKSNKPQEIESSDEVSKGSSQEAAWNLCPANPQMVYCLQYQQGDSDSELDYVSIAPWMAMYGKFLFPFVQSMSPHDPSNAQRRHGIALDDPFHSAMYAMNDKNESSDSSETASVTNNSTVENVISAGQEGDDLQSIGLFSRKVSFRSTGTGFVPYKRCVAESNGENPRQFDRTGEEKRIRLCL